MGDTGVEMMGHRLCFRVTDESAPEDGRWRRVAHEDGLLRRTRLRFRAAPRGRDASPREAALARRRAPGRPAEQRGRAPLYCFGAGGRSRATRAPGASLAFRSR